MYIYDLTNRCFAPKYRSYIWVISTKLTHTTSHNARPKQNRIIENQKKCFMTCTVMNVNNQFKHYKLVRKEQQCIRPIKNHWKWKKRFRTIYIHCTLSKLLYKYTKERKFFFYLFTYFIVEFGRLYFCTLFTFILMCHKNHFNIWSFCVFVFQLKNFK